MRLGVGFETRGGRLLERRTRVKYPLLGIAYFGGEREGSWSCAPHRERKGDCLPAPKTIT